MFSCPEKESFIIFQHSSSNSSCLNYLVSHPHLRGHGHDGSIAEVVLHQPVADRHLHQTLLVLYLTKKKINPDRVDKVLFIKLTY